MRTLQFGIAVATAMFVLPVSAQVEIGPGGVGIGRGECEQLRRRHQSRLKPAQ
jgi:hypothetical protein